MRLHSLRFRLLLGGGVAVAIALGLAWFFLTLLFENHLERRLADELQRDGVSLVAGLSATPAGALAVMKTPRDDRYTEPASGLYWQVSSSDSVLRSRSLWDQALPTSSSARRDAWSNRMIAGPFEPRVIMLERRVLIGSREQPVLVQVGQDAAAVADASREFGRELALFLAILWLALSLAAWGQVAMGLRPLRHLRAALDDLRHSPSERLPASGPAEVAPLIAAINALADAREEDLERARRRAADLAHGLKTPLAALAAQSRRARAAGAQEAADGLDRAISAVRQAIENELRRTRIAAIRRDSGLTCPARAVTEQVVAVIERTERGEGLAIDNALSDSLRLPLAAEDLTELIGAAVENAARYARTRIGIAGIEISDRIGIVVEDDGPGMAEADAVAALERGARLDRSGGQGLGLSIVRDIVETTDGTIALSRSERLDGLRVSISWPR